MTELRFDGRVVVVTGAGRGIGRSHALLLSSRGARVVVADNGCQMDGSGASTQPADDVVREIQAAGGQAPQGVGNYVTAGEELRDGQPVWLLGSGRSSNAQVNRDVDHDEGVGPPRTTLSAAPGRDSNAHHHGRLRAA